MFYFSLFTFMAILQKAIIDIQINCIVCYFIDIAYLTICKISLFEKCHFKGRVLKKESLWSGIGEMNKI